MFAGEWMLDHHFFQISQLRSTFAAPLGWHKGEFSSYNWTFWLSAGFGQIFNTILIQFCCLITRGITVDRAYEYLGAFKYADYLADLYAH